MVPVLKIRPWLLQGEVNFYLERKKFVRFPFLKNNNTKFTGGFTCLYYFEFYALMILTLPFLILKIKPKNVNPDQLFIDRFRFYAKLGLWLLFIDHYSFMQLNIMKDQIFCSMVPFASEK